MKIPKRFKLFGQEIQVKHCKDLMQRRDAFGEAHYDFNEIHIQTSKEGQSIPKDKIEQTFCHELSHFLFHFAGLEKMNNEKNAELFGNLLHQYLDQLGIK